MRTIRRDEEGSIAIFMIVMLVATGLIVSMVAQVEFGLRTSRRAGDSANALQVADAGINEAVQQATTVAGTSFTRTGRVGNAEYTYTATRDPNQTNVWHIDAVGVDATGVKRRVRADAYGESVFNSPMFVNEILGVGAGAVIDSYYSGLNTQSGCTRKGIISVSDGKNVKFTSGGRGNANCTGRLLDPNWVWAMDGCIVYAGPTLPPTGQANCPPSPYTWRVDKQFPLPEVKAPTEGVDFPASNAPGGTLTCDGSNPLKAGKMYFYSIVNLVEGCYIDFAGVSPAQTYSNPTRVFGKTVTIGRKTKGTVNEPKTSTCPVSTAGWSYVDATNNPTVYYCTGWAQALQVNVLDGGTLNFSGSGTSVWAIVNAGRAAVTLNSPQLEMFGAMVAGTVDVKSQFSWHYDETLTSVHTGKFTVSNWREEPL